jgi:opacity protein-like surface antigen
MNARIPLLALLGSAAAAIAEEAAPPVIEGAATFGLGHAWIDGNKAAYQERFQQNAGWAGGFEELRYRRETDTAQLLVDGRLLPGDDSYGFRLRWVQPEKLWLDAGYDQFRTYYQGSGYTFAPNGRYFAPEQDEWDVDRSKLWLEIGFKPEDLPRLRLRYERLTRSGRKPSTEMGETNLTGGLGARSIVPAYLALDEVRDVVSLDVDQQTATSRWEAGVRYEHVSTDNERRALRRPGEPAAQRTETTRESVHTEMFSTHGYYRKDLGKTLIASAGALATTLDTNLGGSRIFGADYEAVFDPVFPQRQVGDLGFLGLEGGGRLKQYVFNGTLLYRPHKYWTIRPAVRFEHLNTDSASTFIATNVLNTLSTSSVESSAQSEKQENRLTGTVDVRYSRKPAWTHSLRAEWHHTRGDLAESLANAATGATLLDRGTDYSRTTQKYALSTQWRARAGLIITGEYYFKLRLNDYDHTRDTTLPGSFDRYPAFITNQDFSTHDFNVRVSWRPAPTLSLVTRYDQQWSSLRTSAVGIAESRGGRSATHIVSQSATWAPRPQLYVTASVNVAYDQLTTPVAPIIRQSDNNYVNGSLMAGYALGKRSDLFVELNRYQSSNYSDNSLVSLPYGAESRQDAASATLVIRSSPRLVYTIRYTFARGEDRLRGDRADYQAHLLYSKIQYTF